MRGAVSEATSGISSMRTVRAFVSKGTCSEAICHVLDRAYGHSMREEEHASCPFAGGIAQHGYQCGQLWGAAIAAGAQAYRLFGAGAQAQTRAILAAGRALEAFRAQNKHIDCFEITELNENSSTMRMITFFLIKGGTVGCMRMAARYAPLAFREINAALCEEAIEVPPAPVSCAALLAEKMGASDLRVVMAAGLAGGIGLSGGACGALGAAIWLAGIKSLEEGAAKLSFKAPRDLALIDRFLECTGHEFECAAIVGRKFESVGDHACHLRQGGCSKILDALAAV